MFGSHYVELKVSRHRSGTHRRAEWTWWVRTEGRWRVIDGDGLIQTGCKYERINICFCNCTASLCDKINIKLNRFYNIFRQLRIYIANREYHKGEKKVKGAVLSIVDLNRKSENNLFQSSSYTQNKLQWWYSRDIKKMWLNAQRISLTQKSN